MLVLDSAAHSQVRLRAGGMPVGALCLATRPWGRGGVITLLEKRVKHISTPVLLLLLNVDGLEVLEMHMLVTGGRRRRFQMGIFRRQ